MQLVLGIALQHAPARDGRCAVPADVDLVAGDSDVGRDRRAALPGVAVGGVRVRSLPGLFPVSEVNVEQDLAALVELADVRPAAPADDDVSVRQELRVALERR